MQLLSHACNIEIIVQLYKLKIVPKMSWVVLSRAYQSLHRLHANRMKLSELVELVYVSLAVDSKKF